MIANRRTRRYFITSVGSYPVSRLAAGAFTVALRAVFSSVTGGKELHVQQCGKPSRTTFNYAVETLVAWRTAPERRQVFSSAVPGAPQTNAALPTHAPASDFRRIVMVGDNPTGDIRGASAAGSPWLPVLVRTGVFQGGPGSNDLRDPAAACVDGVREAVDLVLQENLKAAGSHA